MPDKCNRGNRQRVVLATKHGKGRLVEPALRQIGLQVEECNAFDTDQLGTFCLERPRKLSARECALYKAQKAANLCGVRYGLGSEGSFGGGPYAGMINWNEEILCLYDAQLNMPLFAMAQSPCPLVDIEACSIPEALEILQRFPRQRWIFCHKNNQQKGLDENQVLSEIINIRGSGAWLIKPDYRAMYCPSRQNVIQQCAEDLVRRFNALCPECGRPDFVVKTIETGLPCDCCHGPTNRKRADVFHCDYCGHGYCVPAQQSTASAFYCAVCNP